MDAGYRTNTSIWSLGDPFDPNIKYKIINYATKELFINDYKQLVICKTLQNIVQKIV